MSARPTGYVVRIMRNTAVFFLDFIRYRNIIGALALQDFSSRYLRSYLGIVWAFVQPLATVLILWFIFTYGLRGTFVSSMGEELPFALWLLPAFIAWIFFSDAFSYSTGAIVSNAFLVKKTAIRLSFLPLVKLLSALIIHVFFVVILMIVFTCYQLWPDRYWLQIPYYMLGCCGILFGLGLIASSLSVFAKDVDNAIGVLLQFGFWMTPVFWDPTVIENTTIKSLLKLNPVYYITQGYRDCFVDKIWFWDRPFYSMYFWCAVVIIALFGAYIFRKLRPSFADVL